MEVILNIPNWDYRPVVQIPAEDKELFENFKQALEIALDRQFCSTSPNESVSKGPTANLMQESDKLYQDCLLKLTPVVGSLNVEPGQWLETQFPFRFRESDPYPDSDERPCRPIES